MLTNFVDNITTICQAKRIIIAYSGGLDSHVLLHLASNYCTKRQTLLAVHINHGLQTQAVQWAKHCEKICDALAIPWQVINLHLGDEKNNIEATARAARYQALAKFVKKNDVLLMGHHVDDQAETYLLQLLRGAGIKGLAAMPQSALFAEGHLVRPLLTTTRAQLHDYAQQHQLHWIEDASNQDLRFDRNFLRQQVIPLLKQRWPQIANTIARSAQHCARADSLLSDLAHADLSDIITDKLSVKKLLLLSVQRQMNAIRTWLHYLKLPLPSEKKLQHVVNDVLHAKADATPLVSWHGVQIRRYRHYLYAMTPLAFFDPQQTFAWQLPKPLTLPIGTVTIKDIEQLDLKKLPTHLTIRFRQGGEYFHPAGRQHSQCLKKLMQTWHIPPWQRQRIPLLYHQQQLIAVLGHAVHKNYDK
ncbi:MAG: tRNA lysidine(34) synthetase TilS [Gammaproteobacteria bacterium]|nr:tRNA lysidine(34) synthetase TilS [Gammaproteobacteria bacterium]